MDVLGNLFSNDTVISTYDWPLVARRNPPPPNERATSSEVMMQETS